MKSYRIKVTGLVQGVGFRPFIYRLAMEQHLKGWVENRNDGVVIEVNCTERQLQRFKRLIYDQSPAASDIQAIDISRINDQIFTGFAIVKSKNQSNEITEVSPDIAVCQECLEDMEMQDHRISYPFINCTNCGPRFSIIKDLPYDRAQTTMEPFELCETCRKEYEDVLDRRFHAQPVACNHCGPVYQLQYDHLKENNLDKILDNLANLINEGKIISIKGVGGFQIACDAFNDQAIATLRKNKNREAKPFAVMFRSLEEIKKIAWINREEELLINSWSRPIVILKLKEQATIPFHISMGFNTIGCMLPYMPFHYQLMENLKSPAIILTSGNLSDEPIVIDNTEALLRLGEMSAAVLTYNRDIYNRVDDSVAMVVNDKTRMIRRSRGYVPRPLFLPFKAEGIFAAGAELVNCFAMGKGQQAIMSQHIGDLKNLETLDFYAESYQRFKRLFRVETVLAVHDLHPDYLSTGFAEDLGIQTMAVQHHHAHIAAVMVENNINDKVLGIAFDGTGLGTDGHIWGGEFLLCDYTSFDRLTHFEYIPLPGGDAVTRQPWRTALSYLYTVFDDQMFDLPIPLMDKIDRKAAQMLIKAMDKKINCPLSSSAGRLFDAVAALLGLSYESAFHAEAPMRLENMVSRDATFDEVYPYEVKNEILFGDTFKAIVEDIINRVDISIIASKFHQTLIHLTVQESVKWANETGIEIVALSGGTFQNRILLKSIENQLLQSGLKVVSHQLVPSNDAGIALGQLAIAAYKMSK